MTRRHLPQMPPSSAGEEMLAPLRRNIEVAYRPARAQLGLGLGDPFAGFEGPKGYGAGNGAGHCRP